MGSALPISQRIWDGYMWECLYNTILYIHKVGTFDYSNMSSSLVGNELSIGKTPSHHDIAKDPVAHKSGLIICCKQGNHPRQGVSSQSLPKNGIVRWPSFIFVVSFLFPARKSRAERLEHSKSVLFDALPSKHEDISCFIGARKVSVTRDVSGTSADSIRYDAPGGVDGIGIGPSFPAGWYSFFSGIKLPDS